MVIRLIKLAERTGADWQHSTAPQAAQHSNSTAQGSTAQHTQQQARQHSKATARAAQQAAQHNSLAKYKTKQKTV